jgi:hypothetical protein
LIRDSFLRHRGPFPKYIVHGHTPTIYLDPQQTMLDVRDNRCNVVLVEVPVMLSVVYFLHRSRGWYERAAQPRG